MSRFARRSQKNGEIKRRTTGSVSRYSPFYYSGYYAYRKKVMFFRSTLSSAIIQRRAKAIKFDHAVAEFVRGGVKVAH